MGVKSVETALYWNTPFIEQTENLRSALLCLGSMGVKVERCSLNEDIVKIIVKEFPTDVKKEDIKRSYDKCYDYASWNCVKLYKSAINNVEVIHE